jgi:mono/diheme cytochrome c family protein
MAAVTLAGPTANLGGQQQVAFPHSAHEGLFPLCTGCHEGVPSGDVADFYPDAPSCAGCHDGVREPVVTWTGPTEGTSNVVFDHSSHAEELVAAGDPAQDCAACHIPTGGQRMSVVDAVQLGTCWGCHAHPAEDHVVDADCTSCHVSLAETRFDLARIESLPLPADHRSGAFLAGDHGRLVVEDAARCTTCHTQERCLECHVDGGREEIVAFPAAPSGMALPVGAVHYNVPAGHTDREWLETHGLATATETCVTCHTSNDCVSCHVQPVSGPILALPARAEVVAPGAMVVARAPESHGRMFFAEAHGTLAAAAEASCATCHEESYCVSCHDAPMQGGYHPPDFVSRHTASAFGRDTDCATCHSTQAFCRECHLEVGLTPPGGGRLGPGYHDDGPLWLIRHGQGARQNLESCASCHRQVDCTQCHGVLGAFRVSPHSAGFDAERAWARSPRTCLGCHIGDPLTGN